MVPLQERDLNIISDSSWRSSAQCAGGSRRASKALAITMRGMDNERRSVIFLLQKTAVVTLPGVPCGALHLEEDMAEIDKIQRRARKTSSDTAD